MTYNKEKQKAYYLANKDKIKERQKKYYLTNRGKIATYKKKYAEENRDRFRKSSREYMRRNPAMNKKCKEKWKIYKNLVKEHNGCLNPECAWKNKYDASMLDFHHIDASTKSFTISKTTTSMQKLKNEINKCTVVCANCHRLITRCNLQVDKFRPMQLP